MRRVLHSGERAPKILSSEMAVQSRGEITELLSRSDSEIATRRAPVNERIYRHDEVRDALNSLFRGKCAYCEDNIGTLDVDHHRPRANAASGRKTSPHHYAWLAYDWRNLLLVCGACQRRKQSRFPVRGARAALLTPFDLVRDEENADLLDPGHDRPERHLDFTLDGRCHARTRRGAATIEILDLNRDALIEGRSAVFEAWAEAIRGQDDPEVIGHLAFATAGADDPHAGAMQILCYRYASEIARRRGQFLNLPFDETEQVLPRLHYDADLALLRAAFDTLEKPAVSAQPAAPATAAGHKDWHGWSPPIRRVEINQFKAIEHLTFEFAERRSDVGSAASLMLLGENATGKSSILEAVTLTLAGADMANAIGLRARDFIRRADQPARARQPLQVRIEFYEGAPAELVATPDGHAFEGTPGPSANVLAYGSRRFFLRGRRRRAKSGGIRALFDPMWVLPHPDLWLRTLDEARFHQVARALREVLTLPNDAELVRDPEEGVLIRTGPHEVSIERHSDGYRSLFGTAVDVMHGMMGTAPDLSEARGVVLIDEIETHLHPRWKLRVMAALRRALPQVQFIVTTHDPLCLRGMGQGEVEVMIRDDAHHIERLEGLPDVRGMRAEQLLTSDYFGLASTADPELELELAQRVEDVQSGVAPAMLDKIVGTATLGDTAREQLAVEAMDEFLKARERGSNEVRTTSRKKAVAALRAVIEADGADE